MKIIQRIITRLFIEPFLSSKRQDPATFVTWLDGQIETFNCERRHAGRNSEQLNPVSPAFRIDYELEALCHQVASQVERASPERAYTAFIHGEMSRERAARQFSAKCEIEKILSANGEQLRRYLEPYRVGPRVFSGKTERHRLVTAEQVFHVHKTLPIDATVG